MHRLIAFLVCGLLCIHQLVSAADPISDKTARYECRQFNSTDNSTFPVLTIDLNSVNIKLPNATENGTSYNLQNGTEFHTSVPFCDRKFFNATFQLFKLYLDPENYLEMQFVGSDTSYNLDKISYYSNETKMNFESLKPDLRMDGNEFKPEIQGYKCANLALSIPSTRKDSKESVEIELGDFMFFAFQNGVETSEVTRLECRQDPKSSTIPMIVGAGLLAFAVVIGVIYFIKRDKAVPAEKS